MMKGAADARAAYTSDDMNENDAAKYAALRNLMYRKGKTSPRSSSPTSTLCS